MHVNMQHIVKEEYHFSQLSAFKTPFDLTLAFSYWLTSRKVFYSNETSDYGNKI